MTEESSGSLVKRWCNGDQQAASELFRRYADQLIALARSRMPARLNQRLDPEDVVQSVYRSFFAGMRESPYVIERSGDLWRLLVTITLHKLYHQIERNLAGKRSLGRERPLEYGEERLGLGDELLARGPSPVEALTLIEQLEQLMRSLPPPQRRMLELRLQGYKLEEIAQEVQCSQRTVRRLLERLRQQLEEQVS